MSLTVQLQTMLSMVCMGLYIGGAIDTYERFTKKERSIHWFTVIQDILFWLLQACLVFCVLLIVNHGEIRVYIFLAILCGYAMYRAIFEHYYRKALERAILVMLALLRFIYWGISNVFIKPVKFMLKLFKTLCMMVLTSILAILLFFFRLLWRPLSFIGHLLLKWTGLYKVKDRLEYFLAKVKKFARLVWNKKK